MRASTAAIVSAVVLAVATAAHAESKNEKSMFFLVRLCEGDEARPQIGEDARANWDDCETPLPSVPIALVKGDRIDDPVETGKDGIAQLGPITALESDSIRIGVASKTHVCLSLTLPVLALEDGVNYVLYKSPPLPQAESEQESDS